MAKKTNPKSELNIEDAGAEIAARFDALPWQAFSDVDKKKRDALISEVFVIRRDLMKVGKVDMPKAAEIWDAHVPTFVPRPLEFSDPEPHPVIANLIEQGRRKRRPSREPWLEADHEPGGAEPVKTDSGPSPKPAQQVQDAEGEADPRAVRLKMLLEGLEKQYLKADDRYHFRDRSGDVAFEAQDKRLVTAHETPAIVSSMIDLAEARGWDTLKLSGTAEFRREAWLQASLRDLDVTGYRPTKLDKTRLDELRAELGGPQKGFNIIADQRQVGDVKSYDGFPALNDTPQSEPRLPVAQGHVAVLDALEKAMKARGDSDPVIAAAKAAATQKLGKGRVHVGKLVETGKAPYQDKAGEPQSHYLVLEDDAGRREKVWGVDLPRAIEHGKIERGDKVALAFRGRQPVTVTVKVSSDNGKDVRFEKREVERNAWEAVKFDQLRDITRLKVQSLGLAQARPDAPAQKDRRQGPSPAHVGRRQHKERVR